MRTSVAVWLRNCGIAAAALLIVSSMAAKASPITYDISFTANGFGGGAPFSTVSGAFSVTLDPSLLYTSDTPLSVTTAPSNIAVGSSIAFVYGLLGSNILSIGGTQGGVLGVGGSTDDFRLDIANFPGSPTLSGFFYAQSSAAFYAAVSGTSSVTVTVAPTPIPGSLLLLATGLGTLAGGTFFKRRREQRPPSHLQPLAA